MSSDTAVKPACAEHTFSPTIQYAGAWPWKRCKVCKRGVLLYWALDHNGRIMSRRREAERVRREQESRRRERVRREAHERAAKLSDVPADIADIMAVIEGKGLEIRGWDETPWFVHTETGAEFSQDGEEL